VSEKLLLLDGTAEIYRSYFAFKDLRTSAGKPTGAAFGFVLNLRRLIEGERPTHVGVAFDLPAPTFRHEAFADYKATRRPAPSDMVAQIPVIKQIVGAFGAHGLELEGYEADDIIATLVGAARRVGIETTIVGSDKDFYQLLEDGVTILNPRRKGVRIDTVLATEILGVPPSAIPDLLALMGDSSDNIPGVNGIGPKHARALIAEFGSVERLYQNLPAVSNPRIRSKLEAQRDLAFTCLALATLHRDVPVPFTMDGLATKPVDREALHEIFRTLEFATLARDAEPRPREQASLFDSDDDEPESGDTILPAGRH